MPVRSKCAAQPITAATDIYALGAILFELLTGQKAQPMKGSSPLELDRAICVEDVEKPSVAALRKGTQTESRKLRAQLAGDLDTIVLTAMRKEPDRRYHSVESNSFPKTSAGIWMTCRCKPGAIPWVIAPPSSFVETTRS